jgi:multimeric flavodoxin WrbA
MTHVLGVSGSPRDAATAALVQAALLGAASVDGATTEYVTLAGKAIAPCDGCEPCRELSRCVIDDDMQPLYPKLLQADAILVGSPVYFGTVSALCKAFLERVEGFGVKDKKLRLKVGGAIATAGSRNGGQENVMATINLWCHINDMIPVGTTAPLSQWGATGNTGFASDDIDRDIVRLRSTGEEMSSLEMAWMYGRKLAVVAGIVQAGIAASGRDLPDLPYGRGPRPEFPDELYALRKGPR